MTKEQIRAKLKRAHEQEDAIHAEMSTIDKQVRIMLARKVKLCREVSKNMKYRNRLIKLL